MTDKLLVKQLSLVEILWIITLCVFPITTSPFLPMENAVAKPLAIVPALMVVLIIFFTGGHRFQYFFCRESRILFSFFSFLIIGYVMSLLIGSPHIDLMGMVNFWRGIFALTIGIVFYLCFRMMNVTSDQIVKSELLILISL